MGKVTTGILAAVTGFVAGVLLAPKSGKETRADIKRKAGEVKEVAAEKAVVIKEKTVAGFQAARSGAEKVGKEAAGLAGRTSKDIKSTSSNVAKDVKKTAKDVSAAVKS